MSTESVSAVFFGWILLGGENLSGRELAGCALMFVAVLVAPIARFWKQIPPNNQTYPSLPPDIKRDRKFTLRHVI
jgi:drug/metabolite transporter (DMT)-like permease